MDYIKQLITSQTSNGWGAHISSGVDFQIGSDTSGECTTIVLHGIPVVAVEGLPLRGGVRVPEGGQLLCTVQEVSLRHQMSLGEEVVVGQMDVLLGQRGRTQQRSEGSPLCGTLVQIGGVNTAGEAT